MEKVITFPLHITKSYSEKVGAHAKRQTDESKHDYIIKAINQRMEREDQENE